MNQSSSTRLPRPSIQPWHSATSTASAAVIDGIPSDFFAIFTNSPGARSCSAASQASKSAAVGEGPRLGQVVAATAPIVAERRPASSARFRPGGHRLRLPGRPDQRRRDDGRDEAWRQAPGPTALWLVRHGESMGNLADAQAHEQGSGRLELDVRDPDVPLSDTGEAQADALGAWLAALPDDQRPTAVLSSPFARAPSTAELAIAASGWT